MSASIRRVPRTAVITAAVATLLAGCGGSDPAPTTPAPTGAATTPATTQRTGLALVAVVRGLSGPIQTIAMPDAPTHLWVLEQSGRIVNVHDGHADSTPVLDLRSSTASGGERGLLSLALHPGFPATNLVYIHRSDSDGNTLVTEHRATVDTITPTPVRTLLRVPQPFANHNGGSLAFGPDGLLYLGLGDGGAGGDPNGNGQNLDTKLGKLLRVDVAAATPDWRVAAYGLRNPWRFTFDPVSGDGWIGDVGQNAWEEVDVFPKGAPLLNYEWSVREGQHPYDGGGNRALQGSGRVTAPVAEYPHADGCSITGGVVVRDRRLPQLVGRYLFTDYCSGRFWTIPTTGERALRAEPFHAESPVSIDAAADGTVYVTSQTGLVLRLGVR